MLCCAVIDTPIPADTLHKSTFAIIIPNNSQSHIISYHPQISPDDDGHGRAFVVTPSVRIHLRSLARAALMRRSPVLLQGPTSTGKTSLVAYLAAQTGHK